MVLVNDPHTMISSGTARYRFRFHDIVIAIIIGIVEEVCKLIECIKEDYKNGSCRNTVRKFADIMIILLSGYGGSFLGAIKESRIAIILVSTYGAMVGVLLGEFISELALDLFLDALELDVYSVRCENCGLNFECRRYKEGRQEKCEYCRNEKIE